MSLREGTQGTPQTQAVASRAYMKIFTGSFVITEPPLTPKAFQNGSGWVPGAQEGGRVHMTPKNVLLGKLWGQL